jgi:hypothetical protein
MNLQLIEITPLNQDLGGADTLRPPHTTEYNYTAIAIEENGKFYYWAKGVSIEITRYEYEYVIANPKLYYFSTALKLHCKITRSLNI